MTVYHSDHRSLCAHERDWPFRIVNLLEIVGQSVGVHRHDRFKELKLLQDADLIVAECQDLIAQHALDPAQGARRNRQGDGGERPLPLGGGPGRAQGSGRAGLACEDPRVGPGSRCRRY